MTPRRLLLHCLLPTAYCLLLAGCGYQQSGSLDTTGNSNYKWASLYREDISTVAVPIFTNKDFRRGVEFTLTSAIVKQMETHSPYRVAPRDRADTILEGEITSVRTIYLSRDPKTALPQEKLMTVAINLTWKDLRNGRILTQRRAFEQSVTYYPSIGEDVFVGSQDAVEKLATAIVHELQADW